MADEQDILLREIDEELKQENLQQIWKKYSTLIIGCSLLLVTIVASYKGWQAYDLNNRISVGEQFSAAQAMAISKNKEAARENFAAIARNSAAGYQMLANFQLATLAVKKADWVSAIAFYKTLMDDESVDAVYRELAVILGAFAELETRSGTNELIQRASQLAAGASPWRFSAKEIVALAALMNGDKKTATTLYEELSKEAAAPQGLRTRAQRMLPLLVK